MSITHTGETFVAHCDDGNSYKASTVIYCAGKQYRQLGVPGESRFLGQGIAFCATCDAPLFNDKRVAVVGGGNSAFTAARDLLKYASEIHIINVQPDFQADQVLIDQVTAHNNVKLHPGMHVTCFLGETRLTGVRLQGVEGAANNFDLAVEGVFLEIGLEPNTGPVAELLALNTVGEIIVDREQSTSIAGFFAAGDCTDVKHKQIVIASGDGARAALTADAYLQGG